MSAAVSLLSNILCLQQMQQREVVPEGAGWWYLAVFLGHAATREMGAGGSFNESGLRDGLVACLGKLWSQEISWR